MTKENIKEFLSNKTILSLSTSGDNTPWANNLYFSEDDNLNIFFISAKKDKHSHNIANNERIAATIYRHDSPPEGDKEGIQLTGTCKICKTEEEIKEAFKVFKSKFTETSIKLENVLDPNSEAAFYKIVPQYIKYFNNELDSKVQEINLD